MARGVPRMKWPEQNRELQAAIVQAKADASNIVLSRTEERRVRLHLGLADQHVVSAKENPVQEAEHIQAGFHHVGQAREILGSNAVQPNSFRRHQFPFLPPGVE